MQYIFILGKHPSLSVAEVHQALLRKGIAAKFSYASSEAAVIETTAELSAEFFYGLGGSIKFGQVLGRSRPEPHLLGEALTLILKNERRHGRAKSDERFSFGISAYPLEAGVQTGSFRRNLARVGVLIKKDLKELGRARFVTSKESTLSSVVVTKNRILDTGAELLVLAGRETVLIGKTIAVQKFEDLSFRDYGRPGRSGRRGMLPPKLARMMVNLSQALYDGVLLDPFCGVGTVLTEAMLMGYQNLAGSDIDPQAVRATEENVAWVRAQYPKETIGAQVKVFAARAEEIASRLSPESVQAIVTEPTLGVSRHGRETRAALERAANELAIIYRSALAEFGKIVASGGRVVMIIPQFIYGSDPVTIDSREAAQDAGFKVMNPLPPGLAAEQTFLLSPRGTLVYGRPDQYVMREILVLRKRI